ncbi:MAG TPA: DUF333 domain-containing protein [Povalibacter sp.]|nr:DUF333 domain-containing protein [Povalibacter sp.]
MTRFDAKRGLVYLCLAAAAMVVGGCTKEPAPVEQSQPAAQPQPAEQPQAAMPPVRPPNPASENCIAQGGRLSIDVNGSGAQYGVCHFEDNYQCEEWALLQGRCPAGGIRVTGYATAVQRFCAITGGIYAESSGEDDMGGESKCTLPGGQVCEAKAYYQGTCSRDRRDL